MAFPGQFPPVFSSTKPEARLYLEGIALTEKDVLEEHPAQSTPTVVSLNPFLDSRFPPLYPVVERSQGNFGYARSGDRSQMTVQAHYPLRDLPPGGAPWLPADRRRGEQWFSPQSNQRFDDRYHKLVTRLRRVMPASMTKLDLHLMASKIAHSEEKWVNPAPVLGQDPNQPVEEWFAHLVPGGACKPPQAQETDVGIEGAELGAVDAPEGNVRSR